MAKRSNPLSRIKIVFRPGKRSVKIALALLLVLSTIALFAIHGAIQAAEARYEAARNEAAGWEEQNDELNEKIGALGTLESVLDIAKDFLGLGKPGSEFMDVDIFK